MSGQILYEGPSLLDGAPIVAIATDSDRNRKTGPMAQVWILRADLAPHDAVRRGLDRSICGDCPQRHFLNGACYVIPYKAPLAVWRKFSRGGYARESCPALQTRPIRLGAYGDPAAVPYHVWESLLAQGCGRWTGYTHQWRSCDPALRGILMASVDSQDEAAAARAAGWRYFLVVPSMGGDGAGATGGAVECLADSRELTCAACGICDGTRAGSRSDFATSVAITVHGSRAHRLNVIGVNP